MDRIILMKFDSISRDDINEQRKLSYRINNILEEKDYLELKMEDSSLLQCYYETFDYACNNEEYILTKLLFGEKRDEIFLSKWEMELGKLGVSTEEINNFIREKWAGGDDFDDEDLENIRNGYDMNEEYSRRSISNEEIKSIMKKIDSLDISEEVSKINNIENCNFKVNKEFMEDYNNVLNFYKVAEKEGKNVLNIIYLF